MQVFDENLYEVFWTFSKRVVYFLNTLGVFPAPIYRNLCWTPQLIWLNTSPLDVTILEYNLDNQFLDICIDICLISEKTWLWDVLIKIKWNLQVAKEQKESWVDTQNS